MNKHLFVYGEDGSGKGLFAIKYSKGNIYPIPNGLSWPKTFTRIKHLVNENTVFLWNSLYRRNRSLITRIPKLDESFPNHTHIIISRFPPEYYSKRIQDFLIDYNFIPIKLVPEQYGNPSIIGPYLDNIIQAIR